GWWRGGGVGGWDVGGGARKGRHRARGLQAYYRAFEGAEAAHPDVHRHAHPEKRPVPALEPCLLLSAQLGRAGDLQRLAEGAIVLAAVVVLAGGRLVGKRGGRDEVLAPDLLGRLA